MSRKRSKGSMCSMSSKGWDHFPVFSILFSKKTSCLRAFVPLCQKKSRLLAFVFQLPSPLGARVVDGASNTKHQTPNTKQQTTNTKHHTPNNKKNSLRFKTVGYFFLISLLLEINPNAQIHINYTHSLMHNGTCFTSSSC